MARKITKKQHLMFNLTVGKDFYCFGWGAVNFIFLKRYIVVRNKNAINKKNYFTFILFVTCLSWQLTAIFFQLFFATI